MTCGIPAREHPLVQLSQPFGPVLEPSISAGSDKRAPDGGASCRNSSRIDECHRSNDSAARADRTSGSYFGDRRFTVRRRLCALTGGAATTAVASRIVAVRRVVPDPPTQSLEPCHQCLLCGVSTVPHRSRHLDRAIDMRKNRTVTQEIVRTDRRHAARMSPATRSLRARGRNSSHLGIATPRWCGDLRGDSHDDSWQLTTKAKVRASAAWWSVAHRRSDGRHVPRPRAFLARLQRCRDR